MHVFSRRHWPCSLSYSTKSEAHKVNHRFPHHNIIANLRSCRDPWRWSRWQIQNSNGFWRRQHEQPHPRFFQLFVYVSPLLFYTHCCSCLSFLASWWQLFITLQSVGSQDAKFINSIEFFAKTIFDYISKISNQTSRYVFVENSPVAE